MELMDEIEMAVRLEVIRARMAQEGKSSYHDRALAWCKEHQ